MSAELNEDTSFKVSVKTLIGIAFAIATIVGMWFALQADIAEAKELPVPPPPDVTRMEYDMKDQLIIKDYFQETGASCYLLEKRLTN